ncbi:MAG: septal ring lytic transglycosylase RlpA family protein [Pseudomonadota bacterium]
MPALARILVPALLASTLAACGSAPRRDEAPPTAERAPHAGTAEVADADAPKRSPYPPAQEDPSKRGDYVAGGLYAPHIKDSAPEEIPDVDAIPEPEVKAEPRSRVGNRSYAVQGKRYQVRDSAHGYVEEGMASFYGRKFHGRLTSNQEVYDMYAFTAAHKTLPLPSYVRVTNLANGRSVVVRVNDRGPFHAGRIIDLSYAAATKLGFIKQGTARVEVRALTPGEGRGDGVAAARRPPVEAPPVATVEDNAVPADEFERWMRERGIRFATGTLATGNSTVAEAPTGSTPAEGDVLLQLAAFSARDNAERARERLVAGGVEPLRIDEAIVNGQPVWRLRIGPVPSARAQELSVRAADLGFGQVQIVRD